MDTLARRQDNAKLNSPSKRRWHCKAGELLSKSIACRTNEPVLTNSDMGQISALVLKSDFLSKKLDDCVRLEEMESLLEEADCIGISANSESQYKLMDLHKQVVLTQKLVQRFLETRKEPNFGAYVEMLSKITKIGVCFPAGDELRSIVDLNKMAGSSLEEKMDSLKLFQIITQVEANLEIIDEHLLECLQKR